MTGLRDARAPVFSFWNGGIEGVTVAQTAAGISSILYYSPGNDMVWKVLINLGVNDMNVLPAETTWENDYWTLLDAVHSRWPLAQVYIAYPWRQGFDAMSATVHGWVDTVIAGRSDFAASGPDEAVTIKAGDDGATNTTDGVHYSTTGATAWGNAWKSTLGY